MKISFSTLGCPEWTWGDILAMAKDLGFDGIEVRGIEHELHVSKTYPFSSVNINATKAKLEGLGLAIPCLTSSSGLFKKETIDAEITEAMEYIDTAAAVGAKFVRVLGDGQPAPGENVDLGFVAKNLSILAQHAKLKNVTLLVETNGVLADSKKMLDLMKEVNHSSVAVLWDIHHPYRFMGESMEDTYNRLKDHIKHIHIKDSMIENGIVKYKMPGYGDIPVKQAIELLMKNNYPGFITFEWVKRWNTELEDPGVAFSHFIHFMRQIFPKNK